MRESLREYVARCIVIDFCDAVECPRNNLFHLIANIGQALLRNFVFEGQLWYRAAILNLGECKRDRFVEPLRHPLPVRVLLSEFLLGESCYQVTQGRQVRQHV